MIHTKNRIIQESFKFSETIFENESEALPRGLIDWDHAVGSSIYDKSGNKWIDMTSGIFLTNIGHSNNFIKNAIKKQINNNLLFNYQYGGEIRDKFVKKLLEISPNHFQKVILTVTGSEATDTAYKLMKYWAVKNNKKYIITINGNYHGHMLGSMMLTKSSDWAGVSDPNVIQLNHPTENKIDLKELPPLEEIAAIFLETYRGWDAGFYPINFINSLYELSRKHNFLFGFDEAQSGFYRLGTLYGYQTYNNKYKPDLICLAKGLSASLPISCVLATKELIDINKSMDIWGTHSGNTLCCAAGLANLEYLDTIKFREHLDKIVPVFEKLCHNLEKLSQVKKVNIKGMVAAIIFDNEKLATDIVKKSILNGVLTIHTRRESIKLAPPLIISKSQLKEAFLILENNIKVE